MKLGLGTVQFGLDYGISNQKGKTPLEEVKKTINTAYQNGIKVIDTACLYGNSEEVLGLTIQPEYQFKIVTKSPKFDKNILCKDDAEYVEETFYDSLTKLKQSHIYGFLLKETNIEKEGSQHLVNLLDKLKDEGKVEKVGVSIYGADDIDIALKKFNKLDIVQLPINILDQRLKHSGYLKKLKDHGVEIHARSAFLQGVLLMEPDNLPDHFISVRDILKTLHKESLDTGINSKIAALSYVLNLEEIDSVIVGVNDNDQLIELLDITRKSCETIDFDKFAIDDISILDPSRWQIKV